MPLGVLAAWKAHTWIDRAVMVFAVVGFSMPVFVIGYFLIYGFALGLRWFPVQGYRSPFVDPGAVRQPHHAADASRCRRSSSR